MTQSDSRPVKYQANGNGSYTYRWNIHEVTFTNPDGTEGKRWEYNEVIVWATVTANKITQAVLNSLWDKDYEQKLINDYISSTTGLYDDIESKKKVSAYKDFLAERKAVKDMIDTDCAELNIK